MIRTLEGKVKSGVEKEVSYCFASFKTQKLKNFVNAIIVSLECMPREFSIDIQNLRDANRNYEKLKGAV